MDLLPEPQPGPMDLAEWPEEPSCPTFSHRSAKAGPCVIHPRAEERLCFLSGTKFESPCQISLIQKVIKLSLQVREVALDYNNCGSSPRMARLIQEIQTQREKLEAARLSLENQCSVFEKPICRSTSNVSSLLVETSCWPPSTTIPRTLPLSIQGLACKTNRTLNFFLMDSDQYPNYLRQLGDLRPDVAVIIDPQVTKKKTSKGKGKFKKMHRTIFSSQDESHYVLRQSVTRENVEQLIINYTQNSLKRFRRSVDRSKPCQPGRVCIRSISANEFEAVVLNPTQDVLVIA